MSKIKIGIYLISICICTSIEAQRTLSFKECIDIAFQRNLNLKNQLLNDAIASNNLLSAQYRKLPTINGFVNGNASWGRGIDPYTNTYANQQFNTYNSGLNMNWTLFNGFYNINDIKSVKYDIENNKSILQKLKNDLTIDIATRYTNILYYKELISSIELQLDASKKNIEFTQKKIEAGALAKNDIYKIIAQKDLESSNLIQAKNQLEMNWVDLKQLLNFPLDTALNLKEIDLSNFTSKPIDKNELKNNTLLCYPPILQAQNQIKKSEISLKMAQSALYPTLSLGANIGSTYSTFNKIFDLKTQVENNLSYGTSLNLNIPIFNQLQTKMKVKAAKINIEKAALNLEIEQQKTEKIVIQSYNNFVASQKKLEASASALYSNEMNFKNDKIKYELGKITGQELNISKTNFFNAQANFVKDKYETWFNYYTILLFEGKEISF